MLCSKQSYKWTFFLYKIKLLYKSSKAATKCIIYHDNIILIVEPLLYKGTSNSSMPLNNNHHYRVLQYI